MHVDWSNTSKDVETLNACIRYPILTRLVLFFEASPNGPHLPLLEMTCKWVKTVGSWKNDCKRVMILFQYHFTRLKPKLSFILSSICHQSKFLSKQNKTFDIVHYLCLFVVSYRFLIPNVQSKCFYLDYKTWNLKWAEI